MTTQKILQILDAANKQLKASNTGITIYKPTNSNRLSLRATLPAKPGSTRKQPFQQAIPLRIYCNAAGIKIAKLEAQKLGAKIALGEFKWNDYLSSDKAVGSAEYWISKFKEDYFNKRELK